MADNQGNGEFHLLNRYKWPFEAVLASKCPLYANPNFSSLNSALKKKLTENSPLLDLSAFLQPKIVGNHLCQIIQKHLQGFEATFFFLPSFGVRRSDPRLSNLD